MKTIKNILGLFVLLLTIVFTSSCSKEDDHVSPYGNFSSFTWWSSPKGEFNLDTKSIKINKFIAFKDLSRGALSHQWRIQEGSFFLTNVVEGDTLNYAKYIKPNAGLITNESLAYVLFTKVGESEVQIVNTFKDSVAGAQKIEGIWTASETITVTVNED